MTVYDAVILAGGAASRLGGVDKPALTVGGRTLLDRVLDACTDAGTTVVVGPPRATARTDLRWTREQPSGGGPVAAVAAGLAALGERPTDRLLLLAADLPFLDRRTVARLLAALGPAAPGAPEAAVLVDAAGRDQPLTGAYRRAALAAALGTLGEPAGRPLRRLLAPLRTVRLADLDSVAFDCDTWEELALARDRAGPPASE